MMSMKPCDMRKATACAVASNKNPTNQGGILPPGEGSLPKRPEPARSAGLLLYASPPSFKNQVSPTSIRRNRAKAQIRIAHHLSFQALIYSQKTDCLTPP